MRLRRDRRPDVALLSIGLAPSKVRKQRVWLRLNRWQAWQPYRAAPDFSYAVATGAGPTRDDAVSRCSAELDRAEAAWDEPPPRRWPTGEETSS